MSKKIAFTKLGLKKLDEVKTILINDQEIEIKQYLSINDKLTVIANTIGLAADDNNFVNPIKSEVFMDVEIIEGYTNITFTEKQKEDAAKLYDLLKENGIFDKIFGLIPDEELSTIKQGVMDITHEYYRYKNSFMGVLDTVQTEYNDFNIDSEKIKDGITNPETLGLLKDVLTKMG